MSDDDLTDYFAAAVNSWKTSPEARRLRRLQVVHQQACRAGRYCAAEVYELAQAWRQARVGSVAHACAADLGDALAAARRTLLSFLRAASVKLLTRIGEEGGPPWEIIHRLTPELLGQRADALLASLQAEIETPLPER
jgi:hypothetical protein